MTYNREELLQLENPYEVLGNGDVLAEHSHVLNALNAEEKERLALEIIKGCPSREMRNLGHALNALRIGHPSVETFYSVISAAHQLKIRIEALRNNEDKHSYRGLLDESITYLVHCFPDFSQSLLRTQESIIAENLALYTPEDSRSDVAQQINILFPRSTLSKAVGTTFALRREITLLLGDTPELFFTSKEFNRENCLAYSRLFSELEGHEDKIGLKLAQIKSLTTQKDIKERLASLTMSSNEQANPFKHILDKMNAASKEASTGRSPSALFAVTPAAKVSDDRAAQQTTQLTGV